MIIQNVPHYEQSERTFYDNDGKTDAFVCNEENKRPQKAERQRSKQTTMGAQTMRLCATIVVTFLALFALIHVGQFLATESSMDREKGTRSLRPSSNQLMKISMFSKFTAENYDNVQCKPSPNRTVVHKEDLELSCAEFRRKHRPTAEEAFGYLGEQAVKEARELRKRIQAQDKISGAVRIAIGTGPGVPEFGNFIATDLPIFDVLNTTRLSALLQESTVEAIFASHVWEHFSYSQAILALQNVRCLMKDNAVARIGVPDAQHPDEEYHMKKAREGFPDKMFRATYRDSFYAGHRALWTEEKFAVAASMTGLNARPLEWWSAGSVQERRFCFSTYNDIENGRINRSLRYDKRNTKENPFAYTSLIVDLSPQILLE